jgi:1-acyl-sn-glycerol-3-phosphate acyltransferase
MSHSSQFTLLGKRRFLPFFITQSLGAFNDNLFKQSLILAILFKLSLGDGDRSIWVNLCALLFILPFFLFSALGGQFGEKFAKDALIRAIKLAEIAIMAIGALGFITNHLALMLVALFAMGTHSALFGPVKYSILPQALREEELVGGNGLVEMGTFLAILAGTIGAGVMMSADSYATVVAGGVVGTAVLGYLASRWIPGLPPHRRKCAGLEHLQAVLGHLRLGLGQPPAVSRSIVGNSWFWFVGAIYLTQIPAYAKDWLHGDGTVVTLVLTVLGGHRPGLAAVRAAQRAQGGNRPGAVRLVRPDRVRPAVVVAFRRCAGCAAPHDWLAAGHEPGLVDLAVDRRPGVFGGFYIVPLYALIQARTAEDERARVIAANNILNALFMVVSAIVTIVLLSLAKLSIPQLFLVVSLLNIAVNAYIFRIVPEFTMRFLIWLLSHSMYRVQHRDLERIPDEGAALLVCNHVSFVDALLIGGAMRRPIRFVMYYKIYNLPVLNFIFRTAGTIPIAGRNEDQAIYERAFARIAEYLADGELVCIFPEGKLTADGEIDVFKGGVSRILEETPVPVIPLALQGCGAASSAAIRTRASSSACGRG